MFDLGLFVEDCAAAGRELNAADYICARLRYELRAPQAIASALPDYGDEEVLLHADEHITVFLIQLSPNVLYPPHNHNMAATIALFSGEETSTYYRLKEDKPVQTISRTYAEGELVFLPADVVHSVANPGLKRSAALHIYYGNLPAMKRKVWHPETGAAESFSERAYFRLVKPFDPAKPFATPHQDLSESALPDCVGILQGFNQ